MTTQTLRKCRICGFTGHTVSKGIYQTRDGRYLTIDRCEDHLACSSRRTEVQRRGVLTT